MTAAAVRAARGDRLRRRRHRSSSSPTGPTGLRPDGFWFMEMNTRLQGRAPGHRGGHRDRPRRVAAARSLCRRAAAARPGRRSRSRRPCGRGAAVRGGSRRRGSCPRPARLGRLVASAPRTGRARRSTPGSGADPDGGSGVRGRDGLRVGHRRRRGRRGVAALRPDARQARSRTPRTRGAALDTARARCSADSVVLGTVTNRDVPARARAATRTCGPRGSTPGSIARELDALVGAGAGGTDDDADRPGRPRADVPCSGSVPPRRPSAPSGNRGLARDPARPRGSLWGRAAPDGAIPRGSGVDDETGGVRRSTREGARSDGPIAGRRRGARRCGLDPADARRAVRWHGHRRRGAAVGRRGRCSLEDRDGAAPGGRRVHRLDLDDRRGNRARARRRPGDAVLAPMPGRDHRRRVRGRGRRHARGMRS